MREIKFLKPFLNFKVGDVTAKFGADICAHLVKDGVAEYHGEDAKKFGKASAKPAPKKAAPKKAAPKKSAPKK